MDSQSIQGTIHHRIMLPAYLNFIEDSATVLNSQPYTVNVVGTFDSQSRTFVDNIIHQLFRLAMCVWLNDDLRVEIPSHVVHNWQ